MSFHFSSWLRGVWARLSGQSPGSAGTAVRHKAKRGRRGPRPQIKALEPRETPVTESFAAGSYVIDKGQPTQTIGNALKPYSLVYGMVTGAAAAGGLDASAGGGGRLAVARAPRAASRCPVPGPAAPARRTGGTGRPGAVAGPKPTEAAALALLDSDAYFQTADGLAGARAIGPKA